MAGYPPPGSGYPYGPGAGYGDKPPKEGKTSSSPPYYCAPPSSQPHPYGGSGGYGGPPGSQQYGAPYGDKPPKEGKTSSDPYYSAPPSSQPHPYGGSGGYGAPYGDKPPKEGKTSSAPYYGAPPSSQPHPYGGSGGYGAPYGAPPHSAAAGGYGSPFAALVPSTFPPGTDPNAVACFQAADRDGSGMIDDKELQSALSGYNQAFSLRTVHLLMYLFTKTNVRRIGKPFMLLPPVIVVVHPRLAAP
jgi:calcium-binding protein CML